MGGTSPEREVSLNSGKNIATALVENGHKVIEFDPGLSLTELIKELHIDVPEINSLKPGLYSNLYLLKLLKVDIVFNGLHGGKGENGVIQTLLDELGIKYTGSGAVSCMLAMDKEISKMLLERNGLPVAKYFTLRSIKEKLPDLSNFPMPVIVKPADGGSSLGHTVLENGTDLPKAVLNAFKYGSKVLIEEFVSGKEIAAAVLNGAVLPLVHIKPQHGIYDYECKYTPGMSSYEVPAALSEAKTKEIQYNALKMYNLLGCVSYARVDFLLKDNGEMVILELNTLPGMTSTSLVPKAAAEVGYSFSELIESIVQEVIRR